jgi:hypothetical protein
MEENSIDRCRRPADLTQQITYTGRQIGGTTSLVFRSFSVASDASVFGEEANKLPFVDEDSKKKAISKLLDDIHLNMDQNVYTPK